MWVRVGWAAACFAAIMGFSRLSYGLLVPPMRTTLGGSLGEYGAIGTANLLGYFIGALLATRLAARTDRARSNALALFALCACMAASGAVGTTLELGVLRFATGVFMGLALTLTLSISVGPIPSDRRGLAASIVWAGGALGVAFVGFGDAFVPAAGDAWRGVWYAMGVAGALVSLGFVFFARPSGGAALLADDGAPIGLWAREKYLALAAGYFAYGFGYIAVVTFFGAALAQSHAASQATALGIIGVAGCAGALVWGPLLDRYRSGMPLAAACALAAIGTFGLSLHGAPLVFAGALVLGVSFIGVPAMIGALVQQREPARRYARAFAMITTTLGVGQIVGQFVAGLVAERYGTAAALHLAAAALALGAACTALYRRPQDSPIAQPA